MPRIRTREQEQRCSACLLLHRISPLDPKGPIPLHLKRGIPPRKPIIHPTIHLPTIHPPTKNPTETLRLLMIPSWSTTTARTRSKTNSTFLPTNVRLPIDGNPYRHFPVWATRIVPCCSTGRSHQSSYQSIPPTILRTDLTDPTVPIVPPLPTTTSHH